LPWNRLKGESGKAYEAFMVFRDLGATRSCAKTASTLSKSGSLIRRWKLEWRWDVRARAWDDYLLTKRDEATVDAQAIMVTAPVQLLAEMNQRHLAAAQQMQQKALLRLAQVDPADLSMVNAWLFLQQAVALERLVMNQLPEEPKGEAADQDAVVALLSDPAARDLAAQLAAIAGHGQRMEQAG
jgi:hypothetical protein